MNESFDFRFLLGEKAAPAKTASIASFMEKARGE